ncbi:MAG TPA: TMEM175 family protein [Candidatus Saccharimonadales bacterium]|nr:TMEM175 family protein [Candidatus Saccharimonadales bacterium]
MQDKLGKPVSSGRLEAFSDGVIAVIITLMVLELPKPHGATLDSLRPIVPSFLVYVFSFRIIATYWNNHHHLFIPRAANVTPRIMWFNLHFLFWLSLVPFFTGWLGEYYTQSWPTACFAILLLITALSYQFLQHAVRHLEESSGKTGGIGAKGAISLACYVLAIPAAFMYPLISDALFVIVAAIWFVPESRR